MNDGVAGFGVVEGRAVGEGSGVCFQSFLDSNELGNNSCLIQICASMVTCVRVRTFVCVCVCAMVGGVD